jgi:DNA uptake protein ComE-like DNA-binding protein
MAEMKVSDKVPGQITKAQDMTMKSVRAWNELLMTSADMAFDVVLKNWNYSRSLRGSADQAVEDAIKTQHRYTSEMMQVWRGYTNDVQEIVSKTMEPSTDHSNRNGNGNGA